MATPTQTDPNVAALNAAREVAVKGGGNAYGGNLKSLSAFSGGAAVPPAAATVPTTLTSQSLTPQPAVTIKPAAPATQAAGFQGYMGATSAQIEQERQQKDASKSDFLNSIFSADTESGLQGKFYDTYGVDQADLDLKDINNQILSEQVSARHQIEALQRSNPQGLGAEVIADKIDDINRASISKQADLAVIQLSKQGRYDSAKAVADRAVSAIMEQQRNKQAALKFNYEENRDAFDKDEQRAFETAQKERDRELDNQEYRLRAQFDQTLKQNDPLYKAQLSKARADAAKAIAEGKAAASPVAMAQSAYTSTQIGSIVSSSALKGAVGPNIFARSGGGGLDQLTGAKQNFLADVDQLRQSLTLQNLQNAKANGATFGALSDSELKLLSQSATKLDSWAIKGSDGKVTGYNANESDFKKELDKVNNFSKIDYLNKGGDPSSIGAQVMKDGTVWTQNSDGTFTQLK